MLATVKPMRCEKCNSELVPMIGDRTFKFNDEPAFVITNLRALECPNCNIAVYSNDAKEFISKIDNRRKVIW